MIVVLFMGALNLLSLGVIGEYIRLIFLETKQRPTYIVGELRRRPLSPGRDDEEMEPNFTGNELGRDPADG